jgi:Leucine-rich repeat (LRR) protein
MNSCFRGLAAVLFIAANVQAATDITDKFTDSNFKTAVYTEIGKSSPAPIYDSDVDTITELYLYGIGIKSLAGIEYFTNLHILDCSGNQLSTLDVSNCTALKELSCFHNQLTTLDVSNNTALKELSCFHNQLTTLDVSNCTALMILSCSYNYFTSIDKIVGPGVSSNLYDFIFDPQNDPSPIRNTAAKKNVSISFAGIRNGQITLNLKAGNYVVELYNLQGRLISKTDINAVNGINFVNLSATKLSKGMLVLNVKQAGVSVLCHKVRIK